MCCSSFRRRNHIREFSAWHAGSLDSADFVAVHDNATFYELRLRESKTEWQHFDLAQCEGSDVVLYIPTFKLISLYEADQPILSIQPPDRKI